MKLGKLPALPWYLRLIAFLAVGGVMNAGTLEEAAGVEREFRRLYEAQSRRQSTI